MNTANPVTCDARNPQSHLSILTAGRAVVGQPKTGAAGAYSLRAADAEAPAAGWHVREDPEYYVPDALATLDYKADRKLIRAADAHAEGLRQAMALLDDAENLLGVLLASIEGEGDSRAMQADTVLRLARKKLRKAHGRIDRQDADHRNLFVAYFELKARSQERED